MKLPSIYVIGDSISIGYGPYLEKSLTGIARYGRKEGEQEALADLDNPLLGANGGDSSMVRGFMELKIAKGVDRVDLLVVNCGLHDIKSFQGADGLVISEAEYEQNLEKIIELYPKMAKEMLWIRTTPIDDEKHAMRKTKFNRLQKDVDRYNVIADAVMAKHDIPSIDLTPVCVSLEDGISPFRDGVQFIKEVMALQGGYLGGRIAAHFSK